MRTTGPSVATDSKGHDVFIAQSTYRPLSDSKYYDDVRTLDATLETLGDVKTSVRKELEQTEIAGPETIRHQKGVPCIMRICEKCL